MRSVCCKISSSTLRACRDAALAIFVLLFSVPFKTLGQREWFPKQDSALAMQWIGDTTLVLETELTLAQYMEFVFSGYVSINESFPWGSVAARDFFIGEGKRKKRKLYGISREYEAYLVKKNPSRDLWPGIMNSPVTGVTYNQAKAFCRWRTVGDSLFALEYNLPYRLVFDLPSPTFFDQINVSKDSLDKNGDSRFNYSNAPFYKKLQKKRFRHLFERCGRATIPRGQFEPDSLGLYDIQGNAAEMTSVRGIAKGGSYLFPAKASYPGHFIIYTKDEEWLGFRIMARKIKR